MTKQQYIEETLRLLNEAGVIERQAFDYAGGDNSDVVKQAVAVYPYAWRKNITLIPRTWLTVKDFTAPPENLGDGTGRITLPADYYQLYAFRLKGWSKNVYTADQEATTADLMQDNPYARGTPNRPVCIIRKQIHDDGQIRDTLYYYSLPRHINHEIEHALYIPVCPSLDTIPGDADIGVDTKATPSLCCLAASCVAKIFLNQTAAQILEKEAIQTIYGLIETEKRQKT